MFTYLLRMITPNIYSHRLKSLENSELSELDSDSIKLDHVNMLIIKYPVTELVIKNHLTDFPSLIPLKNRRSAYSQPNSDQNPGVE